MTFVRFVVSRVHPDSATPEGVLGAAYDLSRDPDVSESDRSALLAHLEWFEKHLLTPTRFNRSSSKGHYRRATKGISWFRDSSTEHISRTRELVPLLEAQGYSVTLIHEERVGYLVYEDSVQVVAEPFAETRTR